MKTKLHSTRAFRAVDLLAILATLISTLNTQAGKPPATTPAAVEFRDAPGDRMVSDGGFYVHDKNKNLTATIDGNIQLGTLNTVDPNIRGIVLNLDNAFVTDPGIYAGHHSWADVYDGDVFARVNLRRAPDDDDVGFSLWELQKGETRVHALHFFLSITILHPDGTTSQDEWELSYGDYRTHGAYDSDPPSRVLITRETTKALDGCDSWSFEAPSEPVEVLENGLPVQVTDVARVTHAKTQPSGKTAGYDGATAGLYHVPMKVTLTALP